MTAYDVSAMDFSRIASMPTSATSASMSRSGSMPSTGGVPERKRRTPATGVYVGPIRNGSVAPIHPWTGCTSSSWWRAAT